ncbi:MAG: ABC transporter substrate-binding protein [Lachnospiraceae bacterium]|nr:ABC transporter substrate-binding protein [Lachnospiraceae bacterium]
MKRIIAWALVLVLTMSVLVGCGNTQKEETTTEATTQETTTVTETTTETTTEETTTEAAKKVDVNIAALKGPTVIGMTKVIADAAEGNTANNYNFTIAGAADEITPGLIKGEIQIAAVPTNLASVLYNKTEGKVRIAAINTLGVLYILENGESIQSIEDLKGKTIYSMGQGTTPEYTLRFVLSQNGIDPDKDVTIEYKSEATEVVGVLAQTEGAIGMLPQPQVTAAMAQNDKLRVAIDVTEQWEKSVDNGSTVTTGSLVVNADWAAENPEALAAFLEEYKASVEYVNNNVDDAAAKLEELDLFKAGVIKKAIPMCNIVFITGDDMKTKVSGYLQVLFDQNPASVGGALPGEEIFLN